ncbi:glycosyltransferase family 1 protein, partial [bacterium]|nr:glycosyltransferase family 1 protein [bacterium]
YPARPAKQPLVLTVCHLKRDNVKRKGLETFIAAARILPRYRFVIAGRDVDGTGAALRRGAPANLELSGHLEEPQLIEQMGRARVYAQLSAHEGFGCALAEAMLCGCVPVVTDRGSLPEVAGPDALTAAYGDAEGTAARIVEAMGVPDGSGYRSWIENEFSLERRRTAVGSVIDELAGRG